MKYCPVCGSQIEENVRFCTNCGAAVEVTAQDCACEKTASDCGCETATPDYGFETAAPDYGFETAAPVYNAANAEVGSAFGTSIAAIILCSSGLPGWIVAGIARKKCKRAIAAGATGGKLKAANIISRIALPISIVMTFVWLIYIIAIGYLMTSASYIRW